MYNPLKNIREFEELLQELDAMIKADFEKFRKELSLLAKNHGVDTIFEENSIESLDQISENLRQNNDEPSKISSGEINS
jgi:hypothetical protein